MEMATSTIAEIVKALKVDYWSQFFLTITGAFVAGLIGLCTVIFRDWYEKWHNKSNLETIKIAIYEQNSRYIYRLILENRGDYSAENAEVELIEIIRNKKKLNFVPSPMRWTHLNGAVRDIFPNQVAFLDILESFEVNQENYIAELKPLYIDHLREITRIEKGETLIKLKIYQKNGQTKKILISIDFENIKNLPLVKIVNEKTD